MDRDRLAARIQEILKKRDGRAPSPGRPAAAPPDEEAAFAARCSAAEAASRVLDVLGGSILDGGHGACVVVDRDFPAHHRHGHHAVERFSGAARASAAAVPWFLGQAREGPGPEGGAADDPAFLFFDLETTGLAGGAGTYAFLVGFGFFDADGFHTRQFFLRGYGEERALLLAVQEEVGRVSGSRTPVLVTYNGRSFDVPLIETRYQMHRMASPFDALPHIDMLIPARRLWRKRVPRPPAASRPSTRTAIGPARGTPAASQYGFQPDESPGSCALTAIERDILGLHREDDVPGWEIPARYFAYARTGDAAGLAAVLEHNRLDLLSLGAVTAVVLEMAREGAGQARDRHDALALGRLLEYLGRVNDAEHCYDCAASSDGTRDLDADRLARAEALHWLALHRRRAHRFDEAAEAWRELSEIGGIAAELRREALEALAIHHEHRAKDLEAARLFALRALDLADDARRVDEVRHRLGRLSRKIGGGERSGPSRDPPPF
jgi:uncharacterized protein